jgi:hypothetical protein
MVYFNLSRNPRLRIESPWTKLNYDNYFKLSESEEEATRHQNFRHTREQIEKMEYIFRAHHQNQRMDESAAMESTAAEFTSDIPSFVQEHSPAARVFNNFIEDFTKSNLKIILRRFGDF